MLVGAGTSYLLIQWSRTGGLGKALGTADATPWLWVGGLAALAVLMASAWYRFGRGLCTVAPIGFVIAAAMVARTDQDHLAPPLLAVAFACMFAVGVAMWVEERVRRAS